ncbi:MAG: thiol-disulfide oxidoreductase DCC family protein [Acidobacteriota bacterium]
MASELDAPDSPKLQPSVEEASSVADAGGGLGVGQDSSADLPDGGASAADGPILLFDGVCNLCDSAVNFVIDHDRGEQFRFAALQSQAAREALERAGALEELPDSMVLIDRGGVHTRSDAALAVAGRLSFPWSLLAAARVVPRFVRDPLYAWIARNRYRWFGKQNACRIPTPGLQARFLDANEPVRVPLPVEESRSAALSGAALSRAGSAETFTGAASGFRLGGFFERFLLIYPLLFMLPFPLTLLGMLRSIPGFSESSLASLASLPYGIHAAITQPIIGWMGETLTGEVPSFTFTGSGDGLASYLGVLLYLYIAVAGALGWSILSRSAPVPPRLADVCRVLLRYYLASVMLSYGLSKVFPLQFSMAGPDRLLQPFGDSSPMGLLWTFMGASPGYQIFAGAAEVLGGLLLLFRRTTLLGALVVAAVMTNVFAMNMFFDVPVKVHSFHYLMFAIFLVVPDVPRLFGVLIANLPVAAREQRPFWHGWRRWGKAAALIKVTLIAALLASNIDSRLERMTSGGPWTPQSDLEGIYWVDSFALSPLNSSSDLLDEPGVGEPVPDAVRWVRVGLNAPFRMMVRHADGTHTRLRMTLDEEASTVALFRRGEQPPSTDPLSLERLEDGRLRLSGVFEDQTLEVILRIDEEESLLTSRGFRWINEVPFNR